MQFLIDLCCFGVVSPAEYTFMGSLIIREVIKDLVPKGIKQAKVIMLAGTRSVTSSQCLINNMSDDTHKEMGKTHAKKSLLPLLLNLQAKSSIAVCSSHPAVSWMWAHVSRRDAVVCGPGPTTQ